MKSYMKKSLLVTAMFGAITGCNVDVSQDDVDKASSEKYSGEGTSTGAVTRKDGSSITVNGIRFNVSQASINLDGQTGSQDQIKLGQVVTITADYNSDGSATASMLTYDDSLQGPVDSVNLTGHSLIVMGQTILVNNETLFDGITLETIAAGQVLEISGLSNSLGQWQASYIGLSDQSITEFDTLGVVSELDAAAMTFKINDLTIDYSQVRDLNEVQQWIANDKLIDVYGTMTESEDGSLVLLAAEVESEETIMGEDGELLEIEGLVTTAINNGQFQVSGVTVLVNDETQFDFGEASLLVVDALVEVEGTINEDGTITAEYIFVEPENLLEVASVIEAIDVENNTVTILGKTFKVNESTLIANEDMLDDYEDWDESDDYNEDDFDLSNFNEEDFNEEDFNDEDFSEANLSNEEFDDEDFNDGDYNDEEWDDEYGEDDWQENISTLTLSNLSVGDYVEVAAYNPGEGQPLVAIFLGKMEADEENEVYMAAPIESIETTQKTITVFGETVDLTAQGIELYSFLDFGDDWDEYDEMEGEEGMDMSDESLDEDGSANEEAEDETPLSADEFLQKASVGSQVFMSGINNGGSITWQYVEVEEESVAQDDTEQSTPEETVTP